MDSSWHLTPTLLVAGAIGAITIYIALLQNKHDPREPPLAKSTIPVIGHAIGIMRKSFNYYAQLSRDNPGPIFTMALPGTKMYIVTSPALIQAVQKQPKALAFPPIEAKFACQICGSSPQARDILMKNVNGEEGDWGLSMESYVAIKSALAPGEELDGMNRIMLSNIKVSLDALHEKYDRKMHLSNWLRETITIATTTAVYGPLNPYRNLEIRDAFWDFEKELMKILIGFLPSLVAAKGLAGRNKVAKAFVDYFESDGHEQASILMRNRFTTSAKHGVPLRDIASYEVGGSIAILVNTAPAAFWTLFYLSSHTDILEEIRKEVTATVRSERNLDGNLVNSLDVTSIKTKCPLLTSTFQEILRHRSMGASIRQVMQDTLLDGRWLLKKDSIVQIPSLVLHEDPSIWGNDSRDFDPRRFIKDDKTRSDGRTRANPTAFRAFGGGSTLCPGRHFATNEILAFASMFVLRFDMRPVQGSWTRPQTHNTNAAAVIMEPDTDIEVEISARPHRLEGEWVFSLRSSDRIFAMAAEDKLD